MMSSKYRKIFQAPTAWKWGAVTIGASIGLLGALRAARATGIPASGALVYSGTVTDASGKPLASPQSIGVTVYDAASGGKKVCAQSAQNIEIDAGGHFQVSMPDACTSAVAAQPDLWVEISVDGSGLGRSKIGAVPYAVSAGDAARLQGQEPSELAVPSGMIGMFASSCPSGWSICDGKNGTPNLVDAYPKGGTAFAATTGSNTHSHTLTGMTSTDGAHHHFTEITWDYGGLTPAGAESLFGNYRTMDDTVVDDSFVSSSHWSSTARLDIPGASGHADSSFSLNAGMPTTSVGGHNHSVTGTTDAENHEPKHATVLFCVKN